jgi:hypothetical protein
MRYPPMTSASCRWWVREGKHPPLASEKGASLLLAMPLISSYSLSLSGLSDSNPAATNGSHLGTAEHAEGPISSQRYQRPSVASAIPNLRAAHVSEPLIALTLAEPAETPSFSAISVLQRPQRSKPTTTSVQRLDRAKVSTTAWMTL